VQEGARPLLIVGGNLALDFANTVDDPGGPADFDHLGDVERCREWARHRGLLEPSTAGPHAAEERALRELRRLRDVVQAGFTAVAHGRPFPDPEWRELRRAVAHAVAHADLAVDGERVVLRRPGDGLGAVGDAVARARAISSAAAAVARRGATRRSYARSNPGTSSSSSRRCSGVAASIVTASLRTPSPTFTLYRMESAHEGVISPP